MCDKCGFAELEQGRKERRRRKEAGTTTRCAPPFLPCDAPTSTACPLLIALNGCRKAATSTWSGVTDSAVTSATSTPLRAHMLTSSGVTVTAETSAMNTLLRAHIPTSSGVMETAETAATTSRMRSMAASCTVVSMCLTVCLHVDASPSACITLFCHAHIASSCSSI